MNLILIDYNRISKMEIPYWYPTDRMPEGDESKKK